MKKSKIAALIVAGGRGLRLGGELPKQYLPIAGESILRRSVRAFIENPLIDIIRVIIHPDDEELYHQAIDGLNILPHIYGGDMRQQSVYNGLKSLEEYNLDYVLIHDAARPMVSQEVISNVANGLEEDIAVIPVAPVTDTMKRISDDGEVINTVNREKIYNVQTPQGFWFNYILNQHNENCERNFSDDALLMEEAGIPVKAVKGDINNSKITMQEDIIRAESILMSPRLNDSMTEAKEEVKMETRVGTGFDVHAFCDGDNVRICGVDIPHDKAMKGHSDSDVGLHALVDAILGAIAEGDIGQHFPPSDDKWRNIDSSIFVAKAMELLEEKSGKIINVDITIICEKPKISPYSQKMRKIIAEMLKTDIDRMSVKATTTEGLGFTGRGEGIAAQAAVSVLVVNEVE